MSGEFDHHTFVDGKGYLFTLPALGLPDPKAEWIEIQGAMTRNQLDTMDALSKAKATTGEKAPLCSPAGDCVTVDVEHGGALWLLPLVDMVGEEDPQAFSVKVRRVLAPNKEGHSTLASQDVDGAAAAPDLAAQAVAALSLHDSPPAADTATTPSPVSPSGTRPLSSASSDTSDEHEDQDDSSSSSDDAELRARLLQPRQEIPQLQIVTEQQLLGPLMSSYRYAKGSFDWNYSFEPVILSLQYVDALPRGDPVPQELRSSHRETGSNWVPDFTRKTLFHLPSLPLHTRQTIWKALTRPNVGYPCEILQGRIRINLGLSHDNFINMTSPNAVRAGPALLKVIPLPSNHACQPSAASPEVSYFLNRYQLVVEQKGRSVPVYQPLAAYVNNLAEELFLSLLGQCASAAANAAGKDGAMPFCQHPPPLIGMPELLNVGVRLRDGGARFPVIVKGRNRHRLKMPGTTFWQGMYGDYNLLTPNMPKNQTREVNLLMPVPKGRQDILFRVLDVPNGKYNTLQYAFRMQGSFKPVPEGEWRKVELTHVEEDDDWVIEFLLNMARESVGIGERSVAE